MTWLLKNYIENFLQWKNNFFKARMLYEQYQ
jgi:hypothetical protein